MQVSNAAVDGRQLLGGAAVSPKQVMASAFNLLVARGGKETIEVTDREKTWDSKQGKYIYSDKIYRVDISAKNTDKDKAYARALGRAMVGFASDPMDYAGLGTYKQWWQ
jgi:hypothetical protein